MADFDLHLGDDGSEAQAVKRRISPWWILGAVVVVIAVLLGVRRVRKSTGRRAKKEAARPPEFGGTEFGADEPSER